MDRRGATRAGARVTDDSVPHQPRASGRRSQGEAIREVKKSRCSDLPRRRLKRSALELSVWIQLDVASDRLDARTCMSARKASLSVSTGHAHAHQRAKPACVRSRGWIPDHEHRCRSLTADPGAVLVDRKHARLRRPIVREALEVIEPREKPVAAEGLHGDVRRRRGQLFR